MELIRRFVLVSILMSQHLTTIIRNPLQINNNFHQFIEYGATMALAEESSIDLAATTMTSRKIRTTLFYHSQRNIKSASKRLKLPHDGHEGL